jgi:glutathione S-transferase
MTSKTGLVVHHIPVCPFSQRLEILLALKDLRDAVEFRVVDITRPRADRLLERTRGSTALPVLETQDGKVIKESLVILAYLEDRFPRPPIRRADPWERAVEGMLIAQEGSFTAAGYRLVMNRRPERREALVAELLDHFTRIDDFLVEHAPDGPYLFEPFGLAEVVFTPILMRFWFLEYYEAFELPEAPRYARVRRWRDACLADPRAQQVSREEIVKLYHDYAQGVGNGALPPGRSVSSFTFSPHWSTRPWPPRDKSRAATDRELGLLP